MVDQLSDRLAAAASGKNVIGLLALVALFWLGFRTAREHSKEAPSSIGILDAKFSYSPETAYAMISAYGDEGRKHYAAVELTLDMGFPLVYPTSYSLAISYLFRRAFPAGSRLQKLNLVPFVAMLGDYGENVSIVTMLLSYPRQLDAVARLSSRFTSTKWLGIYSSTALLLIGVGGWLARRSTLG